MSTFLKPLAAPLNEVPQCLLYGCKKLCAVSQSAECVSAKPPPLDSRYDHKDIDFAACLNAAAAKLKGGA